MEIKIPESWEEVSVFEFNELREVELDSISFLNSYSKNIAILCTLLGVEEEYFDDFDIDEITEMFNSISFINKQPSIEFHKQIGEYYFKGLDTLTLGEFIDIEYFMSDDYYKNLNIICSILYRRQREGDWDTIEVEPYKYINIWKRKEIFDDVPITSIFGVIQHIITWKGEFMKTYANIFHPIIEDADQDDQLTEEDLEEERKEKELAKFSWQFIIDKLTNEDITKVDSVTDLPLIQVMNYLTMRKIKPKN